MSVSFSKELEALHSAVERCREALTIAVKKGDDKFFAESVVGPSETTPLLGIIGAWMIAMQPLASSSS
ncbi:MAG TPA: hypothetical protein VHD36_05435 [Pirellulales bacterium]|nr:hypothetical protein [Pirellulales bacterium]